MLIMAGSEREFASGTNVMCLAVYCAGCLDDAFVAVVKTWCTKIVGWLLGAVFFFETINEASGV